MASPSSACGANRCHLVWGSPGFRSGKRQPVFSSISSSYTCVWQTDNGRFNLHAASRGRVVGKGHLKIGVGGGGLVSPECTPTPGQAHNRSE